MSIYVLSIHLQRDWMHDDYNNAGPDVEEREETLYAGTFEDCKDYAERRLRIEPSAWQERYDQWGSDPTEHYWFFSLPAIEPPKPDEAVLRSNYVMSIWRQARIDEFEEGGDENEDVSWWTDPLRISEEEEE